MKYISKLSKLPNFYKIFSGEHAPEPPGKRHGFAMPSVLIALTHAIYIWQSCKITLKITSLYILMLYMYTCVNYM